MVLIFGLGAYKYGSGTAAALYFARLSKTTGEKVIVTDSKPEAKLNAATINKLRSYEHVDLVLGKHRLTDVRKARLIVRNPGVPMNLPAMKLAKQLKKPITNDVGIFLQLLRDNYSKEQVPVVAITGTRGKSTTTALVGDILKNHFGEKQVHVGGNIGRSPLFSLSKIKAGHVVVLELSSWLLIDLKEPSFNIAVFTNLFPDHMNFYSSMKQYQRDKERIFHGQTQNDTAIINKHNSVTLQVGEKLESKKSGPQVKWFGYKRISGMKLLGKHSQANVAAAYQVARALTVPVNTITTAVKQFTGVPNRLEFVRTVKGRTFYNDTTATSPDAAIAALNAFPKKVILIAGGNSKQLSLKNFAKLIPKKTKQLILLAGDANHELPSGIVCDEMNEAVQKAWDVSTRGDIILLSPGCTWLPKINEFERGKQFIQAVNKLT